MTSKGLRHPRHQYEATEAWAPNEDFGSQEELDEELGSYLGDFEVLESGSDGEINRTANFRMEIETVDGHSDFLGFAIMRNTRSAQPSDQKEFLLYAICAQLSSFSVK